MRDVRVVEYEDSLRVTDTRAAAPRPGGQPATRTTG